MTCFLKSCARSEENERSAPSNRTARRENGRACMSISPDELRGGMIARWRVGTRHYSDVSGGSRRAGLRKGVTAQPRNAPSSAFGTFSPADAGEKGEKCWSGVL